MFFMTHPFGRHVLARELWLAVKHQRPSKLCRFNIKLSYSIQASLLIWMAELITGG